MFTTFRRHALITLLRIFDLAAVCVVFLASMAMSSGSLTWPGFEQVLVMRIKVANFLLFTGYIAFCSAIFSACGFYRSHRLSHWHQRLSEILLAVTAITGVLLLLRWTLALAFATNEFLIVYWLSTFGTLMLTHEIARRLVYLARLRGRNLRHVIIVGERPDATALAERVRQEASLGYRILRIIDTGELTENGRLGSDS
jgi:FlaA1/EpsC-like NDP-sugar epimerase